MNTVWEKSSQVLATFYESAAPKPCHLAGKEARITEILQRSSLNLVAHHSCDPCCATQCRAYSVAAKISAVFEMSQRHAPPKKDPVTPVLPAHCQSEYFNCSCRGSISKRNRSRYTGVSWLHSHASCYTVPPSRSTSGASVVSLFWMLPVPAWASPQSKTQ